MGRPQRKAKNVPPGRYAYGSLGLDPQLLRDEEPLVSEDAGESLVDNDSHSGSGSDSEYSNNGDTSSRSGSESDQRDEEMADSISAVNPRIDVVQYKRKKGTEYESDSDIDHVAHRKAQKISHNPTSEELNDTRDIRV